jgi:hypothetical protein
MTQTWLDSWVYGAAETARQAGVPPELTRDDLTAALAMCTAGAAQASGRDDYARIAMYGAMLPFLALHNPRTRDAHEFAPPYGLRLARETVTMLAHARPPQTTLDRDALASRTWYIDLPHRSVMLGEEQQVRAIFAMPTPGQAGSVAIVVVLTEPGADRMTGRYAWMWDYPEATEGADVEMRDPRDVREAVSDLVRLVILYHLTASRQAHSELPRITPAQLAGPNRRQWQKKATLFRVIHLDAPPDRLGRPADPPHTGRTWRLDQHVPVAGHFRMQPYGPRAALRRLQWIDPHYRGPADGREKPPIEVL